MILDSHHRVNEPQNEVVSRFEFSEQVWNYEEEQIASLAN